MTTPEVFALPRTPTISYYEIVESERSDVRAAAHDAAGHNPAGHGAAGHGAAGHGAARHHWDTAR
jgi:hypothetical protein